MGSARVAICEYSTPDSSFEEDVAAYRRAGVQAISICDEKLDPERADAQQAVLRDSGLKASSGMLRDVTVLPSSESGTGGSDLDEHLARMEERLRALAAFGVSTVVVVTGARGDRSAPSAWSTARDGLRQLSSVARDAGITLSLEPVRSGIHLDVSLVHGVRDALAMLDEVGSDDLRLCIDVHHLWDAPGIAHDLRAVAERVGCVQLSDWRAPARGPRDRVLPGDGVIGLTPLITALEDGGYTGWYDVEVFSDDGRSGNAYPDSLWRLPVDEFAERARAAVERVWPDPRAKLG
jgi:sugar phosphate isomerase/epimerase